MSGSESHCTTIGGLVVGGSIYGYGHAAFWRNKRLKGNDFARNTIRDARAATLLWRFGQSALNRKSIGN
jgi:hypothetical protein